MHAETGKVICLPAVTEDPTASEQPIVGKLIDLDEPFTPHIDEGAETHVVNLTPSEVAEEGDPLLEILSGTQPLLAKPISGLAEKVADALDKIGCKHEGIEILSVTETGKIAAMLTEDALRFIALDPQNVMDRSINWLMGSTIIDMLDDRFSASLDAEDCQKLANDLWSDIVRRRIADDHAELGQIAERLLYINYKVAYYQTAFRRAQMNDLDASMEPFGRLCAAGNPPIGLLRGRRFLVLTA